MENFLPIASTGTEGQGEILLFRNKQSRVYSVRHRTATNTYMMTPCGTWILNMRHINSSGFCEQGLHLGVVKRIHWDIITIRDFWGEVNMASNMISSRLEADEGNVLIALSFTFPHFVSFCCFIQLFALS